MKGMIFLYKSIYYKDYLRLSRKYRECDSPYKLACLSRDIGVDLGMLYIAHIDDCVRSRILSKFNDLFFRVSFKVDELSHNKKVPN